MEAPGPLRIRLLGGLDVEGVPPDAFGSRKARTVLRVLALGRGSPVSVDRLVDACWGDDPPTKPAEQVAVLVSRLRRALGRERIVHGDAGYSLVADWLDLSELDDLAAEAVHRFQGKNHVGARAAAAAALSLVRGPVAPDELDDEWVEIERSAVDRTVARLRHVGAESALAVGDLADAAQLAGTALDHDPYDEQALRVLMAARAAAGSAASALGAYAEFRARLGEELGIDPSPQTEAVHTAILRGEPPPGVALPPVASPHAVVELPGRAGELAALERALDASPSGTVRIVEIAGEAGIGKTALLEAFASRAGPTAGAVLRGTCDDLEQALPLQVIFDAIAAHLQVLTPEERALVGADDPVVAPLLGGAPATETIGIEGLTAGFANATLLYSVLARLLDRIAGPAPLVLLVDDAHRAGLATSEWLRFVARRPRATGWLVVLAGRPGEGLGVPADERIELGPLNRAAAEAIVGSERIEAIYERSGGNPLFLVELAAADGSDLPATIRDAVAGRCREAGQAAETIRAAALLGPDVDVDLLAAVTRLPPVELLTHLEEGVRLRLLEPRAATFAFRHELVRDAIAADVSTPRAALVHREAAVALSARAASDPLTIAHHARLGGDLDLAAATLARGAALAAERFDYRSAEDLLDRAIEFRDIAASRMARARVRVLGARYDEAVEDAGAALSTGAGADALEVMAWAEYYARDFGASTQAADDGARLATDAETEGRCCTVAGRARHAAGDLDGAEEMLTRAVGLVRGEELAVASAYLGVLRSHQSRYADALDLMRAATRLGGSPTAVSAFFHAHMFVGHAEAMSGRPAAALRTYGGLVAEVERRHAERYQDGRPLNFIGWVLRSLADFEQADDATEAALALSRDAGFRETEVAALLDLGEAAMLRGDLATAAALVDDADAVLAGDLVFGWRQQLKVTSHRARVALATGEREGAAELARTVAAEAERLGVPRYAVPARLLAVRADPVLARDLDAVDRDLAALDAAVPLEAWWLTAEVAHELGVDRWWILAQSRADDLARQAGEHAEGLRAYARKRLDSLKP